MSWNSLLDSVGWKKKKKERKLWSLKVYCWLPVWRERAWNIQQTRKPEGNSWELVNSVYREMVQALLETKIKVHRKALCHRWISSIYGFCRSALLVFGNSDRVRAIGWAVLTKNKNNKYIFLLQDPFSDHKKGFEYVGEYIYMPFNLEA